MITIQHQLCHVQVKFRNAYICDKNIKISKEINQNNGLPMGKRDGYNWKTIKRAWASLLLLIFYFLIWVKVTSIFAL